MLARPGAMPCTRVPAVRDWGLVRSHVLIEAPARRAVDPRPHAGTLFVLLPSVLLLRAASARARARRRWLVRAPRAKGHLENGDKIILPPSALDRLQHLHIDWPILFEVSNAAAGRQSHCGVLEFSGEEGHAYLPYWMMENICLSEGDLVQLRSVSLPKGTFVKLQPHSKAFLDISNPKAVLETTLRHFSCLTLGDTICVNYNAKKFYIDIKELKPAGAVTIIETDCEVDFAPPLDYVEPERPAAATSAAVPVPQYKVFKRRKSKKAGDKGGEGAAAEPELPKFQAFGGGAQRLDGKAIKASSPSASPSQPVAVPGADAGGSRSGGERQQAATGASPGSHGSKKAGKVVFGGGRLGGGDAGAGPSGSGGGADSSGAGGNGGGEQQAEGSEGDGAPKFAAFSGKARRLCD